DSGDARLAIRSGAGYRELWSVHRRWGNAAQQPLLRALTNGHAQALQAVLAARTGEPFRHLDRNRHLSAAPQLPRSGIRAFPTTGDPRADFHDERRGNAHPSADAVVRRMPNALGNQFRDRQTRWRWAAWRQTVPLLAL